MLNVCPNCGEYRADKIIDVTGPFAICPICEHKHPFRYLPLLIIGGASCTGKTAVLNKLIGDIEEAVLLEGDIIWQPEFDKPEEKHRGFFETWLRICKNINQSGRPVVVFNAGMVVPENVDVCIERRYLSEIHCLALTCEDEIISKRLQARPNWRQSNELEFIKTQISFNRWLRDEAGNAELNITLWIQPESRLRKLH